MDLAGSNEDWVGPSQRLASYRLVAVVSVDTALALEDNLPF